MSERKDKHEREAESSSQENVNKKQKVFTRTEDEVLEVLKSWRNKENDKDVADDNIGSGLKFSQTRESNERLKLVEKSDVDQKVYVVIYGKNKPYKKHKTFEFDGKLYVNGFSAVLKDCDGLVVTRSSEYKNNELEMLKDGSHLVVGDQLCEICEIAN